MQGYDPNASLGYTPEISEELLSLIIDLYKTYVKPTVNDLKLQKMIDLIEVAEHEFEKYQTYTIKNEYKAALNHYIVGLFYVYLIIPNSIQFQIKNKNFEIFIFLKALYDKEINMENVKTETANYISYLNEKFEMNKIELIRTRSKRSNTLPSSNLHQDLNSLLNESTTNPDERVSSSSSSTNSSIIEDDLWSPPDLQPNDQLKLVSDNYSNESLNKIPELPSHPPPPPPPSSATTGTDDQPHEPFVLHHANTLPLDFQPLSYQPKDYDIPEDGFTKSRRRQDSYHSVYVNGHEEDDLNLPMIDSKDLFGELKTDDTFWLMFDLRKKESFKINHIGYENIINIDPELLNDIEDFQNLFDVLQTVLHNDDFVKFKNLRKFEKVVIYTDNKNFLSFEFDYLVKFKNLLDEDNLQNLQLLKGGFDSWLKFISKNQSGSKVLKFKARSLPTNNHNLPPSVPPPSPPKQDSSVVAPYDYSKFLPQYSTNGIGSNQTAAAITPKKPPPPPPHYHYHHQPMNHFPVHHYPQQQNYSRSPQSIPSIPENYQYQQPYMTPPLPQQFYQQHEIQHYPQQQYSSSSSYSSDGVDLHRPNNRPRTDSVPTLQKSVNPFVRLSITGLRNMGNTCYINSMIQCLFATTKFTEIFINNKFEDYINPKFNKIKISQSLAKLFQKMYLNGGCSIVPSGFLKNCVQIRPDFKIPNEQQDTQEFLMFLLDQLHDELSNSNNVVNDYPELLTSHGGKFGEDYNKWFDKLINQGLSPISKIFQGQLKDSLKCLNCGFESSNYSTFYMLSLVIPKISAYGKKLKKIQLEDCIKLFTNEEILTGENAWDCPKCSDKNKKKDDVSSHSNSSTLSLPDQNQPRKHRLHFGNGFKFRNRSSSPSPSTSKKPSSISSNGSGKHSKKSSKSIKSLNFVTLPPILIIHLSRFLFYDLSTKDTSIVQYPLILELPSPEDSNIMIRYKLFGVVNHYGTLKSGHYTSITNKSINHDLKNPNWYYFDDEVVKTTDHGDLNKKSSSHMSSSDVYVLFYERIN
ncbi:hypothetical protein WICANDRAFT_79243 [Wickerhamomyces anomalus NRRL Y-366-8]|uniref:ubiquitinyl hydrolase 1 n=1 Tax=Wickerhamomyces anomalus (strain ATCC 58044 / CBS 1984 / NCYC 433 / NRRL Y-366-8) TaxID=683960 RepID=A0A1E3NZR3_WICAA|nr:uncharacterized protein WICANDRAFT_79243 [Wickerhamomyces anomalus NRRL Y-366-8]ODQ58696.1 hypothetical protein WICANDRAFT_79243 [Wickerhamomyces anomalus NRRL Y-366-8]